VNGRFLTRPITGVERSAWHLTVNLLELLDADSRGSLRLLVPPSKAAKKIPPPLDGVVRVAGRFSGHLWEQLALPFMRRRGWLLSPCNVGPLLVRRQIVVMHDAQVFELPHVYSWRFRMWYRLLLPLLARRAKVVLTVSEHSRSMLEKYRVVPAGKAVVVHNGCDHIAEVEADGRILERHGLVRGGYAMAIGSLSPHKNIQMLVAAFDGAKESLPLLVVAGGGNARVFGKAGLQSSDKVAFLGRVSDEELRALYENATVLLFPSLAEGFGLPPLEAMYCGCPVIASTAGALPEVCGEAALYADPQDSETWIARITELCGDPALADRMRAAGKRRAAHFTWKRAARTLLAAIGQID
jgi:glycosyltransferase involved in cell wall biosynthesis